MKEYPYLAQAISNVIEIFRKDLKMTKSTLAGFAWLERRYLLEMVEEERERLKV